jgi:hypothetical protein
MPLPHAFDQAKNKAIRKLALFDSERAAIANEFEKAGIWYLPLKGILLRDCYPNFAMREMTDNDILVDGARMRDVRSIMEERGYACKMFEQKNHDVYSKPPTLEFKMHHALFDKKTYPLYYRYYSNVQDKLLPVNGSSFCRKLTDEDFYLFILAHTHKHYSRGGTGVRSLLDIYLFLRSHPGLNRAYIDAELKKLKITGFEKKMRLLSQKVFTGAALNKQDKKDLEYMILSGYGGTDENREYHRMEEKLGGDDSNASKRRLIRSRVFISGEALEKYYPFVAKHKALYPLLVVYRPIKGAILRPKGILAKYKKIKRFKKKD